MLHTDSREAEWKRNKETRQLGQGTSLVHVLELEQRSLGPISCLAPFSGEREEIIPSWGNIYGAGRFLGSKT